MGDALILEANKNKLIDFAKDGTLGDALDDLEKTGSPDHPVTNDDPDTARTVKLMVSQFKDAVTEMQNGTAPNALRKDFQAFFMHILRQTGDSAISAKDVHQHAKTYLDAEVQGKSPTGQVKTVQQNWNLAAGNSNKLKLLEFTGGFKKETGDLNKYVENLQGAVDDWFDGLVKDNALGDISTEDRDWLKDQIACLNADIPRDSRFSKDFDLENHGKHDLSEDFMKLRGTFIDDAAKMRIGAPKRKLVNSSGFVSGKHVTDQHIARWHDATFRALIAERQEWKIENNPKAKNIESKLQDSLSAFPEIKDFVNGKMNRGTYDSLRKGQVNTVSEVVRNWMAEDGTIDALDNQYLAKDLNDLKDSLYVLDAFADFTQHVEDLTSKYDGDLKNASAKEIYDLQARAREISDQLDNFDKLIDVINDQIDHDKNALNGAVKILDSALTTICDGIQDYTKIAEQHQSVKNQRMLQQLPHVQNLHNEMDDLNRPLAAQDTPASIARMNAANLSAGSAVLAKSFERWKESAGVLNRYADFANQHGDRLVELEDKAAHTKKLSSNENSELHDLQSQAKQISKDIVTFGKRTMDLKEEIGTNDTDAKLFFDAMEKTTRLMAFRLGGDKVEQVSNKNSGMISMLKSRLKTAEIERHMVHGGGRVDMPSQTDLQHGGASAMNIVKAMSENVHAQALAKMSPKPLLDAGKHLASYDNRLRNAMRVDPLAQSVPPQFKQIVINFHNEINDLDEMHRELQALRDDLAKEEFMPAIGASYVPGHKDPMIPNEKEQYLAILDHFDQQVVKVRDQMIAATSNFQLMQQAGRL